MYRLILSDFRSHFKSSLYNLWNNSPFVFVLIGVWSLSLSDSVSGELTNIAITLPCIMAYAIARMYTGYSTKTFLLCPLDTSMRLKYATQSYKLRIIIPGLFFLIANILLVFFGYFSLDIFGLRLIVFLCLAISVNIYCSPTAPQKPMEPNSYPFIGNFEVVNTNSHIINYVMIIITTHIDEKKFSDFSTEAIWVVSIFITIQIITTAYKAKKFYYQSLATINLYR